MNSSTIFSAKVIRSNHQIKFPVRVLVFCCMLMMATSLQSYSQNSTDANSQPNASSDQKLQQRIDRMKKTLELTDDQADKIRSLLVQQEQERKEIIQKERQVQEVRFADGLSKILTTEQLNKWKTIKAKRDQNKAKQNHGN